MALIARPSVTPGDAGCQDRIAERLARLGFSIERLRFGEVDNLWARRGDQRPLLVLAGHTDVVPPGPPAAWRSPPFEPEIRDGFLYGRGAADMKGAVAAMVTACERFVDRHRDPRGSLAVLLTSDEEGPAVDGVARVVATLGARAETIDWCLLGEPSSEEVLGDTIKVGRRGSLSATVTVEGVQGHVAYPERAENPIPRALPLLSELCSTEWDRGNDRFPPTRLQLTHLEAGSGVDNVIPGHLELRFNLRYSNLWSGESLRRRIGEILDRSGLRYSCEWRCTAEPFLSRAGPLTAAVTEAVHRLTGHRPRPSTAGGTSDGRFIAPTGAEVVELGPVNATIHKVDERVAVDELLSLSRIYEEVLKALLG